MYKTYNEILVECVDKLSEEDIEALKSIKDKKELIEFHDTYGRWLRNTYRLWSDDNPLTMLNYIPDIRNGIDYNPKHPDEVSMRIIEEIWEIATKEKH